MKNAKTVGGFKREYKKHRAELVTPTLMEKSVGDKTKVWRTTGCGHFLKGPSGTTGSSSPRTRTSCNGFAKVHFIVNINSSF
jgi:hypothetical protein